MSKTKSPTTPHEERVNRRKTRILEAAAHLFAENGFHRTTTRDIATAADVAEGTIYNYFENKTGLLMALVNSLADLPSRQEMFERGVDADMKTFFTAYFVDRLQQLGDKYYVFLAVLPEVLNTPELRERYLNELVTPAMDLTEAHFRARHEAGMVREMDFKLFVRFMTALILGLQLLMVLGDEEIKTKWQEQNTLTEEMINLLFKGIQPEQGDGDTSG